MYRESIANDIKRRVHQAYALYAPLRLPVYTAEAEPPRLVRIPIPVRLAEDLVSWIDQQAEASDENRSVVIRRLLRDAMERQRRSRQLGKAQPHSPAPTQQV